MRKKEKNGFPRIGKEGWVEESMVVIETSEQLQICLRGMTKRRQGGKSRHWLTSILFIAVAAAIVNAGSWE